MIPTDFVVSSQVAWMIQNFVPSPSMRQPRRTTTRPRCMPRWQWYLQNDLCWIRDMLYLAWWTERHPEYWRVMGPGPHVQYIRMPAKRRRANRKKVVV